MIVYDITQPPETSFEKAKSWVRELQRQADPSIVIMLVGNKADLTSQRKTPRALGEQFAQEEGLLFTEASAKSGDGVEAMFMEIGEHPRTNPTALTVAAKKLPLATPKQTTAQGVKVAKSEETPRACTC